MGQSAGLSNEAVCGAVKWGSLWGCQLRQSAGLPGEPVCGAVKWGSLRGCQVSQSAGPGSHTTGSPHNQGRWAKDTHSRLKDPPAALWAQFACHYRGANNPPYPPPPPPHPLVLVPKQPERERLSGAGTLNFPSPGHTGGHGFERSAGPLRSCPFYD